MGNDVPVIPLSSCQHGHLYRLRARYLVSGVFNRDLFGFIGIRAKDGQPFLFTEHHVEFGQGAGTASPLEDLDTAPAQLDLQDAFLVSEADRRRITVMPFDVAAGGIGYFFADTGEPADDVELCWETNQGLLAWIETNTPEAAPEYHEQESPSATDVESLLTRLDRMAEYWGAGAPVQARLFRQAASAIRAYENRPPADEGPAVSINPPAPTTPKEAPMTIRDIARLCHAANLAICEAAGDQSQKPWHDAEPWQRESAELGVRFCLNHPLASPSDQHEAWTADKLDDGWTYGPTKDADAKTHPCLVPYNELPLEQRIKDYVFMSIVRTCAAMGIDDAA